MVAIFCTMRGFIFDGNSSKQISFKIAFSSEVVNLQENAASKGRLRILKGNRKLKPHSLCNILQNILERSETSSRQQNIQLLHLK